MLEPSNKKLNLPESQRIMGIIDELNRKIEILDMIVYLIGLNENKLRELIRKNLSDEEKSKNYENIIVSMFVHHKSLMETFNKGGQFNLNGSIQTKESMEMLIKMSCKDIIRALSLKPVFFETIRNDLVKVKRPNSNELIGYLNELKELMHERLLTTPNEQREKMDYLRELIAREKSNNEMIKKLKDEQSQVLADKDKDIQVRNDQIRKLDNDLKNVERFSSELVKRTKLDAEQQEASESKASEGRKAKLQLELNQLRQQFQNLVHEHRDQEQILRKEKWKNETNVEGILGRYDDDMIKKQTEYDEIEELHREEKKQLEELEEKFKPLEEEYLKITEERRLAESLRRIEEDSLNKKIMAAVTIQSFWRGFKLRKGLFKKGGKKGGKKKGKKK